jgi:hypothetical protein
MYKFLNHGSMGFRELFWPNWELSASYVQMIGRCVGPFWHRWCVGIYLVPISQTISTVSGVQIGDAMSLYRENVVIADDFE